MTFSERLSKILKEKGIKQGDLADYCNVRPNTISDWKNKGVFPQVETCIKIAERLDVTLDYLINGIADSNEELILTPEEKDLLENYRCLDSAMRAMINIQISALAVRK